MSTEKAFQIFDQLVTSIGLYNCETWLPMIMPKKSFRDETSTLLFWENFQLETLNKKISKMVLGVHKKQAGLALSVKLVGFPCWLKLCVT